MKNTFFLLLSLIIVTKTQDYMCTVWKDTYLYLANTTNDNTTVHIYTYIRSGWLRVGFGPKKDETSLFTFYYREKTSVYTKNLNFEAPTLVDPSTGLKIDNIIHFSIKLPYSFLVQNPYVSFKRDFTDKLPPNETFSLDQPDLDTRKMNFTNLSEAKQIGWCSPTFFKLPGRIFSIHLGVLIPYLFIVIIIMLLCIVFRNEQPLKSRGSGPIIMAFTYMIPFIFEYIITFAIDFESQYFVNCFVVAYLLYTPIQITVIIMFVNYFRYMIILNMQTAKKNSIKKQVYQLKDWKTRTLNIITHPVVIFIFPLIWMVIYSLVVLVIFAIFKFQCGTMAATANRFFATGFCIVIGVLIGILQVWDIIQNYKLLTKCEWKRFFLINDHYYYRLEFLVTPLIVIMIPIWLFAPVPTIFKIIFCDIMNFLAFWLVCLFSLTVTICKFIYKKYIYQPPKISTPINEIFNNEELLEIFLEFSKNEWSMENVYFKKYCINYQKMTSNEERKKLVEEMRTLFLSFEKSIFEINVRKESINVVILKIDTLITLPDDLFEELEKDNQMLLSDVYSRFARSYEYKFYLDKLKLLQGEKN